MVSKIKAYFAQPFPSSIDIWVQAKEAAMVGFLIFAILFLLQPFGTSNLPLMESFKLTLDFGILTFVMCFAYNLLLIKVFGIQYDKPSWTFGKWIVSTIILILLISIANFLFMSLLPGYAPFSWKFFLFQVYMTFVVGIFPLVLFGTITMLNKERFYNRIAENIAPITVVKKQLAQEMISIPNQSIPLQVDVSDILYIESMQNYATIYLKEGRSELIRSTLKSLENQLEDYGIIRTHRSYLVNAKSIQKVTGNAQGLKLTMTSTGAIVPVSRRYISVVKSYM